MTDHRFLYAQLKETIINKINKGELAPGDQLPSLREMIKEFKMSQMTVFRALRELINDGVLYTVPGAGVYVAEKKDQFELDVLNSFTVSAHVQGKIPGSRILEEKIILAEGALANRMMIPQGSQVISLLRLRLLNGKPISLSRSWLPSSLFSNFLDYDLTDQSLFRFLYDHYKVAVVHGMQTISARIATPYEMEQLELDPPGVVITQDATQFDSEDRVIEYSESTTDPQRYPFYQSSYAKGYRQNPGKSSL